MFKNLIKKKHLQNIISHRINQWWLMIKMKVNMEVCLNKINNIFLEKVEIISKTD